MASSSSEPNRPNVVTDQIHLALSLGELAQVILALRGTGRSDLITFSERLERIIRQFPR